MSVKPVFIIKTSLWVVKVVHFPSILQLMMPYCDVGLLVVPLHNIHVLFSVESEVFAAILAEYLATN